MIDITDAQSVYWDNVNAAGGIDGWTVELVIEDTNYNVEQHIEKYEKIREEVVAISQSTGSPTHCRCPSHTELMLQGSPSSHVVPEGSGLLSHRPVSRSHSPTEHPPFSSEQSVSAPTQSPD